MKKSTLISTLAMVVIVALALTTATFAWYSSNSQVTATTTATAALSGDASLVINNVTNAAGTDSTTTLTNSVQMMPMVASEEWGSTTKWAAGMSLWGKYQTASGTDFTDAAAYTNGYYEGDLRIDNKSTNASAAATALTLTVDFTTATVDLSACTALSDEQKAGSTQQAAVKNALRIGIFVQNDGETGYTFKGVLAATTGDNVHYGDKSSDSKTTIATASTNAFESVASISNVVSIAAQKNSLIKVVMWFDGTALDQNYSGAKIENIGFNFAPATPAP